MSRRSATRNRSVASRTKSRTWRWGGAGARCRRRQPVHAAAQGTRRAAGRAEAAGRHSRRRCRPGRRSYPPGRRRAPGDHRGDQPFRCGDRFRPRRHAGDRRVSVVCALLVVWLYIGRSLVARIVRLQEVMLRLANGDLSAEVEADGHGDEIGRMAETLGGVPPQRAGGPRAAGGGRQDARPARAPAGGDGPPYAGFRRPPPG